MTLQETYRRWQLLQPLTKEQEYLMSNMFTVEYNYNSNHIEGNTLTYGQTELLLLFGITSKEGWWYAADARQGISKHCTRAIWL